MKNQREIKKKDPEFYRKLLALLIPMVVQNLMNALVSASDALMVGTLDQNSLSAVSLATQISFVLNLFYAAITIGPASSPTISEASKVLRKASNTIWLSMVQPAVTGPCSGDTEGATTHHL